MSTPINNQFTFKANCKGDLRKLRIKDLKFNWMRSSIKKSFDLEDNFKITYLDEEGDSITIGNLNDLKIALESVPQGKMLKVSVKILKNKEGINFKEIEEDGEENNQNVAPLMKLQKPKENYNQGEVLPLMKLQKPKPQPKEGEKKEEVPLMKLQKPKPKPKENTNQGEVLPLMKLQKPKPQPKEGEKKEEVLPLMKLQKPKPKPKENTNQGEVLPLMKLQKPKPQPKEGEKKEEVLPLMKLQKPKPKPKECKEKIPIVFFQNPSIEQQPVESFPYMTALKDLETLGFSDSPSLRILLANNNGDLERTVNQLLN